MAAAAAAVLPPMLNHRARAARTEQSLCRGSRKGKRARERWREEDGGASRRCLLIGMERAAVHRRDGRKDGLTEQSADDRGPEMRLDEPAEGSSLAGYR